MRIIADTAVPADTFWEWLLALLATGIVGAIAVASIRFVIHNKKKAAQPGLPIVSETP